ncbi:MAG: YbaB/EbfC family nucleoid-associated protein [Oscillospiraceae bacterium]|nr:YbaB/EbfC family nucleoid-associated protein [Oscillospiraceae bacterium]
MAKKFGGMPGGGNMMKQIQKMQEDMLRTQQEMESKEFTATAGGGVVTATVTGARKLLSVALTTDVVDPDDVDMLQDLIVAAVNSALDNAEAEMAQAMQKFTGGMPGLF